MRFLKISDAEVCNEVHAYFNERNIDNGGIKVFYRFHFAQSFVIK